jgi:hypothetical protein
VSCRGCSAADAISAVHSGRRPAATGMLIVHSGQSRSVAARLRSSSRISRVTGSTMT